MKTQFIEFLKKNRCFTAFKNNLRFTTFDRYFEVSDPDNYISGAFTWPEGKESYWSKLNKKWKKQIS